ncbi:hypothetical protein [Wenxinia marina]|uniref:Uncharacterized protein n=1 Tax=Wenxinia marina DSM 24838 TaxID=1123501 RepID=A0A0D0NJ65_9RHOB|nr:hypothetical protein [Wenxinia marina]KIQ68390.1 hypothetical protein Wenmar_03037 [Wenxinia marina DSM 24838]GGL72580.1 hypothetical protein GCM10011392_28980 [Wenxinia marina]
MRGALALPLALAGCVGVVQPTAPEVAARADEGYAAVATWLQTRAFQPLDPAFGGPRSAPDAACIEKARGGALFGVDVVRVCEGANGEALVWRMQTHGRPWQRVVVSETVQ